MSDKKVFAMMQSYNTIVKCETGNIGRIVEFNNKSNKYSIRVFTPLFKDYQFITLSSPQFIPILQIITNSKIHDYGLLTLINIHKFKVIFEEPLLIPFAPRINNTNNNKIITSKIIKWYNDIKQLSNKNKFNVFMCLSYHQKGP
eukprot:66971_1